MCVISRNPLDEIWHFGPSGLSNFVRVGDVRKTFSLINYIFLLNFFFFFGPTPVVEAIRTIFGGPDTRFFFVIRGYDTHCLSFFYDFWLILCGTSRRRFLWCHNSKVQWFLMSFGKKIGKIKKIPKKHEHVSVLSIFWELEGHTQGEKNLPLSISHRFAPSKPENGVKK